MDMSLIFLKKTNKIEINLYAWYRCGVINTKKKERAYQFGGVHVFYLYR